MEQRSELLIYTASDGSTQVQVRLQEEMVWLTLSQIADLFQRDKSVISRHIANIYKEGELEPEATVAKYATVQREGERQVNRELEHYNLDMIISVGYRVNSHVGIHFRRWATQRIREYLVKGFTLDDARLKEERSGYFDELLDRIRDIRSSEKVFYRKVCDIYATSIDYDAHDPRSEQFFATVQNKFHWAIHGHTAAEVVRQRADASKPHMGLTTWPTERIRRQDVTVAKNYLNEDELQQLNLIVAQYLDFAELQAMQRKAMTMDAWIAKLHGFLTLNEREILDHAGNVSHAQAKRHAEQEFDKYRMQLEAAPDELDKAVKRLTAKRTAEPGTKKPKQ